MYHVFIINPASGSGKGIFVSQIIDEYCKENHLAYNILFTEKNNSAASIASKYKRYDDVVIYSVGGDGTLNEIVNGIHDGKNYLSVIPLGTGNDFYKSLKTFKGNKIDLGKVNDKYFINIASIGFDAEIASLANVYKEKNINKNLVYALSLLKNYFTYKNIKVYQNNKESNITIFTVCKGSYYGGGFRINPNSVLDNGLFNIIEAKSVKKLGILNLLTKLVNSTHLNSKYINHYTADKLQISSEIPIICNVDGEIIKDKEFNFSIQKQAINYYNLDGNLQKKLLEKKIIK